MRPPLYQTIDLNNFPGEMPYYKDKGNLAKQVKDLNYSDLYRNLQLVRDQDYKKEVARGQFSPEFSGLDLDSPIVRSIMGYMGGLLAMWLMVRFNRLPAFLSPVSQPRRRR